MQFLSYIQLVVFDPLFARISREPCRFLPPGTTVGMLSTIREGYTINSKVKWTYAAVLTAMALACTDPALGQVTPLTDWQRSQIPAPSPVEPDAPHLARLPDSSLQDFFQIDPTYTRPASVKVVGAYTIDEPVDGRFVSAWGRGFMPENIAFSDGRCFSFRADYYYGTLWNGRLNRVTCALAPSPPPPPPASPPVGSALRLVASGGGYAAWTEDASGTTFVSAPFTGKLAPFFTTPMKVLAMMAANGVDWPGGNVTLITRVDGQLTLITLEIIYDRNTRTFRRNRGLANYISDLLIVTYCTGIPRTPAVVTSLIETTHNKTIPAPGSRARPYLALSAF